MDFNDKQIAILKVAEQVISEKGFEAASIREISKKANINLAMVSYYFGSKEKLLAAMFILKSSEFRLNASIIINDGELTSFQKIEKLTENYINKIFNNIAFHKIMVKEISFLDSTVVFEQIKKMKTANFEIINEVLQEGIERGEFNAIVNTDHVISLVIGSISHFALNEKYYRFKWGIDASQDFAEQTKEKIKNQILYSLKAILTYNEGK